MSHDDIELGPIDYVVLEFPGNRFNGELAPELLSLVERGVVRLIDLVFIRKDDDGTVTVVEASEAAPEEAGALADVDYDLPGLMSDHDVQAAADALEVGTSAALLVWENTWAAPFATAVRRAGGQMVASGRIAVTDLLAALDAAEADSGEA